MVYVFVFLAVWVGLQLANRLPTVQGVKHLISTLNDRGGNILVLFVMSMIFFYEGLRLIYYAVSMIKGGQIDSTNAIILQGLQWITGAAFGGAFGAMLKTMNPANERSMQSRVDLDPNNPPVPVPVPAGPHPVPAPAIPVAAAHLTPETIVTHNLPAATPKTDPPAAPPVTFVQAGTK